MMSTARKRRVRAPKGQARGLPIEARRHPLVAVMARELRRCGVGVQSNGRAQRLVIGVSGGADSTALLLGCAAIAARRDKADAFIEPVAAHVHHHLRASADNDAQFVSTLCERLGIELDVQHINPAAMPGNVSANARSLRYAALAEVAKQRKARFIAVAHHAEDQLETVLMALCRGAGIQGWSGMPSARLLVDEIALVRPLLRIRKTECEDLCRAAGVKWIEDPSNVDVNRARARMRRDVLPVLEELWPGAARRASAATDMAAIAAAGLEQWLLKIFGEASRHSWERPAIGDKPPVVIAAGLRRAALNLAAHVTDELGQDLLLDAAHAIADDVRRPRQFDWPGGLVCVVRSKRVSVEREPSRAKTRRRRT